MNANKNINKSEDIFNLENSIGSLVYKGIRLSFRNYWFCSKCYNSFNLKPWKQYKNMPIIDMVCPNCGSDSVYHSNELSRAIIDKKPKEELISIVNSINNKTSFIKSYFNNKNNTVI